MTDRIELLLKSFNLSPSRFADEIDVQRSSVSHILSGRNKPSLDFITKILSAYPQINPDWLLFNKGSMLRKSQTKEDDLTVTVQEKSGESEQEPAKELPKTSDNIPEEYNEVRHEEQGSNGIPKPEKIILLYTNGTFKTYNPG